MSETDELRAQVKRLQNQLDEQKGPPRLGVNWEDDKSGKLVKVKALRPFAVKVTNGIETIVQPGQVVDVSEERAAQLCKVRLGAYSFVGERRGADAEIRHDLRMAQLVA